MFPDYFFRAALIVLVSLVMVQPAQALLDTAPNRKGAVKYGYNATRVADTVLEACGLFAGDAGPEYKTSPPIMQSGWSTVATGVQIRDWGCVITNVVQPPYATSTAVIMAYNYVAPICDTPVQHPEIPYTWDNGTQLCTRTIPDAPPCPTAGTTAGDYYVHTGDDVNSIYNGQSGAVYCKNGCQTETYILVSSNRPPSIWKVIDGVKQYYSFRNFEYTGQICSAGEGQPVTATIPANNTCAPGQSIIQMGDQVRCLNPTTGQFESTDSASAVAKGKTLADDLLRKKLAEAASAVLGNGGTDTDVRDVRNRIIADQYGGSGSGTGSGSGSGSPSDPQTSFCAENPSSELCKAKNDIEEFCAKHPDFFICKEQDYGDVPDENLTEKNINVAITPVGVGGPGSCPAPAPFTIAGRTAYFDYTTYCNYASGIRPILLAFAWLAAAGILIGGFKT